MLEGDIGEAQAALRHLPADDYEPWIQIGFILKHSFSDKGFAVWDAWSQTAADKYPGTSEIKRIWDGLKPRGDMGLGSLFHRAREKGWNGPTNPVIREMNARFGILTHANRTMIIVKNGDRQPDDDFVWLSKPVFMDRLAAEKVTIEPTPGTTKTAPKAAFWLGHPDAAHYHRLDFDPSRPPGHNGKTWNTWSGFARRADPGRLEASAGPYPPQYLRWQSGMVRLAAELDGARRAETRRANWHGSCPPGAAWHWKGCLALLMASGAVTTRP